MSGLTLYLLRHAKSAWDDPALADFDRPLNARGRREAKAMASVLAGRGYAPDLIVCSTAQRTRETLAALLSALSTETEIVLTGAVYEAAAQALLARLRDAPRAARSVMLIGHNPGIESLAASLVGGGDGESLARMHGRFPPAGLAVIGFEADSWATIGPGDGLLMAYHTPGA